MLFVTPHTLTLFLAFLLLGFSAPKFFSHLGFHEIGGVPGTQSTGGTSSPIPVSLPTLLEQAGNFHRQLIRVHGVIKQPELHLDDTHLRLNFVFRLTKGTSFVTVFGTHDRTKGPPSIAMDNQVEVVGMFFKERELNTSTLVNTLEAVSVTPYPPMEPDRA